MRAPGVDAEKVYLKGDPVNLLALNINSYSAGVNDMWKNCRNKMAVEKGNKTQMKDEFVD